MAIDRIPVEFEYEGKVYQGVLTPVNGMAAQVWFLMVDKFYWGDLMYTDNIGWRFHEQKPRVAHLEDYFVSVVLAWYE
jgi:hypothetical protein